VIPRDRREGLIRTVREAVERRLATSSQSVSAELDQLAQAERHHLADVDDLAGNGTPEELTLALLELGAEELDPLRQALARIDEGTYGACEDCGGEVPDERLLALPFAARCVRCQRAFERDGPPVEAESPRELARRERRLAAFEDVALAAERDDDAE
jgi:DnaK suppressor protein